MHVGHANSHKSCDHLRLCCLRIGPTAHCPEVPWPGEPAVVDVPLGRWSAIVPTAEPASHIVGVSGLVMDR